MKTLSISTRAAILATALIGWGTAAALAGDPAGTPVLGRLDRMTGVFAASAPTGPMLTGTPRSGTLKFVVAITYTGAAPSGSPNPACKVTVTHTGADHYFYEEYGSTKATRSGSTGACTVTVPYRWRNAAAANDVYYEVELVTSAADYSAGTLPYYHETRIHAAASFALPADRATTTTNVSRRY